MADVGIITEALPEDLAFQPNQAAVAGSQLTAFLHWCEAETERCFPDHSAFDRFSVEEFRAFWQLFLRWSGMPREGEIDPVCVGTSCESARFFPELRLNYAECLLGGDPGRPAITACHADGRRERLTRGDLRAKVARLAAALGRLGVGPGDRVVAVARNNVEAVVAALASAAIGATFSSCAPDMGAPAILARFAPLEPVVLLGNLRPEPWDPGVPVADRVAETAAGLPSLAAVVALDDGPMPQRPGSPVVAVHRFADLVREPAPGGPPDRGPGAGCLLPADGLRPPRGQHQTSAPELDLAADAPVICSANTDRPPGVDPGISPAIHDLMRAGKTWTST